MKTTFSAAVSGRPFGLFQFSTVALILLVLIFDGIDAQSLGLVVPVILHEWGIDRADFGLALSASLLGMGIGALAGGWLGDRFGRLNALFGSAVIFGIATIISSQVDSVGAMAALRLIGGIGFGAANPNGLALASEWTPERGRTYVVAVLSVGTPLGGTIAAAAAPFLLDGFGWRGMFAIFGAASVAIGFAALLLARESPSFLLAKGRREEAQKLATRILGEDIELEAEATEAHGVPIGAGVFSRSYARLAWGASLAWSALNAVVYGITAWGTELFTMKDFGRDQAIGVIFWAGLSSVVGAVAAGYFVRAFGSKRTLAAFAICCIAALAGLAALVEGASGPPSPELLWGVYAITCTAGFAASVGISTIYQMFTLGFPVAIRSSGIGFGMLMGRPGGVGMAFAGGYLINLGAGSTWPFFGVMAGCAAIAFASAWIVDRHIPPANGK